MKRRRNNRELAYNRRIKDSVNTLYEALSTSTLTEGFAKYKRDNLIGRCGLALLKAGVIANNGNKTRPQYVWNETRTPDKKLYDFVKELLRAKSPKNFNNSNVTTLVPDSISIVAKPVVPSLALVNFTDKALWDELKSRNYIIKDNCLCKITVLE